MEENNNEVKQEPEVKNEAEVKQESELKKEAQETIKKAKEQMKDINFKEEAKKGKGLLKKLIKNPVATIKEAVEDNENTIFKTALLVIGLWVVLIIVRDILSCATSSYETFNLLSLIKVCVSVICEVLAMALIIHVMNKSNKQTLQKAISVVTIAKIPLIISYILGFLTIISFNMNTILNPISYVLSAISTILMFFVVKEMFNEQDNEKAVKDYVKVIGAYYIVYFVFSFLGIYL